MTQRHKIILTRFFKVWYKIPMAFIGQHSQLIAHTLVFLGRYPITVYHTLRVRWEEQLLDWESYDSPDQRR